MIPKEKDDSCYDICPSTMSDESASALDSTLSELFVQSIRSFGELLLVLQKESHQTVRVEQVNVASVLEEYGRLKIWGDQTKADLPAKARGSLDDTLRHDGELKDVVLGILLRLRALLNQGDWKGRWPPCGEIYSTDDAPAIPIARRRSDPSEADDQDSVNSVSDDADSDSDSDSNNNSDERERERRFMPKIPLLIRHIREQIRSLYSLSALLRRPSISNKYIRSLEKVAKDEAASETIPSSLAFSTFDLGHVAEKVRQWRGLTKSDRNVHSGDEETAAEDMLVNRIADDCGDVWWLCQRLAAANTRRREQLKYWVEHPYDGKTDRPRADGLAIVRAPIGQAGIGDKTPSQVSIIKPPEAGLPLRTTAMSSTYSFSAAAVSDVHDTKTNVRPRTVYAPTEAGQRRSNSVPDPPRAAEDGPSVTCPLLRDGA